MKQDPLERRLTQQPIRSLPEAWREDILARAGQARHGVEASTAAEETAGRGTLVSLWKEWFWPHPAAWGGLAALWLLVLSLNGLNHETSSASQARLIQPPQTPSTRLAAVRHDQLRKELLLPSPIDPSSEQTSEIDPAARPRSQRRDSWSMA